MKFQKQSSIFVIYIFIYYYTLKCVRNIAVNGAKREIDVPNAKTIRCRCIHFGRDRNHSLHPPIQSWARSGSFAFVSNPSMNRKTLDSKPVTDSLGTSIKACPGQRRLMANRLRCCDKRSRIVMKVATN